jgi:hypothetical protein
MRFDSLFHCTDLDKLALHSSNHPQSVVKDAALGVIGIFKNLVFFMAWRSHSCMSTSTVQKLQPRLLECKKEKLDI